MDVPDLLALVRAFGPVGAVALIALAVAGWAYRRDFLRDRTESRSREQQVTTALVTTAAATERHAASVSELARAVERLGHQIADSQSEQGRQFRDVTLAILQRRGSNE